jgi:hypothetical protein
MSDILMYVVKLENDSKNFKINAKRITFAVELKKRQQIICLPVRK